MTVVRFKIKILVFNLRLEIHCVKSKKYFIGF